MKRYATVAIAALAAPAMFIAASGTANASTTHAVTTAVVKAAQPGGLDCQAWMSNSNPKDNTTTYVNVSTKKDAEVTTVAYYRSGKQEQTTTANSRGVAKVGYAVGNAAPGARVKVTVTVTSGRSHASCSTSFTPQKR